MKWGRRRRRRVRVRIHEDYESKRRWWREDRKKIWWREEFPKAETPTRTLCLSRGPIRCARLPLMMTAVYAVIQILLLPFGYILVPSAHRCSLLQYCFSLQPHPPIHLPSHPPAAKHLTLAIHVSSRKICSFLHFRDKHFARDFGILWHGKALNPRGFQQILHVFYDIYLKPQASSGNQLSNTT